jgi:hypothetical protein
MRDHVTEEANLIEETVKTFQTSVNAEMAYIRFPVDEEILEILKEKIAVLCLHARVNANPNVPYISVWESGKSEIVLVYMSPKIETLLGFTPEEIKNIGFGNMVGDHIVRFFEEADKIEETTVSKQFAREARRQEFIGSHEWSAFYKIQRKSGDHIWVADRTMITRYANTSGDNIVYISEGILFDSTDMMKRVPVEADQE